MRGITIAFWAALLLVGALWLAADPESLEPSGFFALRGSMVQLSGVLALTCMSLATILATRPNWPVRWAGGLAVPDLNSGLRVLRRRDLLALAPLLPDRFSLTTTLTLALAAEGDAPVFLPITYMPRCGRSKWLPIRDTWLMGRTVWRGIGWLRDGHAPLALPAPEGAR